MKTIFLKLRQNFTRRSDYIKIMFRRSWQSTLLNAFSSLHSDIKRLEFNSNMMVPIHKGEPLVLEHSRITTELLGVMEAKTRREGKESHSIILTSFHLVRRIIIDVSDKYVPSQSCDVLIRSADI